jgi:hypothetical protein
MSHWRYSPVCSRLPARRAFCSVKWKPITAGEENDVRGEGLAHQISAELVADEQRPQAFEDIGRGQDPGEGLQLDQLVRMRLAKEKPTSTSIAGPARSTALAPGGAAKSMV